MEGEEGDLGAEAEDICFQFQRASRFAHDRCRFSADQKRDRKGEIREREIQATGESRHSHGQSSADYFQVAFLFLFEVICQFAFVSCCLRVCLFCIRVLSACW